MNPGHPLISIITINFNNVRVTCEFLESTKKLTYRNFEIIVVDNASVENPTSMISKNYPDVKLIVNKKNLGFSGGNNTGIKAAKGDYLFLVNNDTEVTPDLFEKLIASFQNDNSIGLVSPKIKYFSHPDIIQYAGFTPINPFTGRNKCIGDHEIDRGQHDTPGYTPYAHGAAMFLKREVIEKAGTLADLFFLYYEELDWSERIRNAGYRIYYEPQATIFHKESLSVGKNSVLKTYYLTRNRILFMRRNVSGIKSIFWPFFLILISLPKNTISFIVKRDFDHLKAFYQGILWNLTHFKNGAKRSFSAKRNS